MFTDPRFGAAEFKDRTPPRRKTRRGFFFASTVHATRKQGGLRFAWTSLKPLSLLSGERRQWRHDRRRAPSQWTRRLGEDSAVPRSVPPPPRFRAGHGAVAGSDPAGRR